MTTSVTVLEGVRPKLLWYPQEKEFTTTFLTLKSRDPNGPTYQELTEGEDSVLHIAQRILGRCHPPASPPGKRTGLVVGYVQSGKTMSFETVIALARDNGYGLVILLAGTKNILLDQSEDRLIKDLGIDDGDGGWFHENNPTIARRGHLSDRLASWRGNPTRKRAVLITVLKHSGHLANLAALLQKLPLAGVPALVIDDESDQAGLNTRAAAVRRSRAGTNTASQTYSSILQVRNALPHHSYLQYTATPQANLLLAQADLLSPEFSELVTPGDAYTGGKAFFKQNPDLVKVIPTVQVPSATVRLASAPKTLLQAFRTFLLAAAHHQLTRTLGKDRNRTMMVHPAVLTASHTMYKNWVETAQRTTFSAVKRLLKTNPSDAAKLFADEYAALKATFPDIRPLPALVDAMVDEVFDDFRVVEINGTQQAEKRVKWKETKYWVLVGAAKLDRGYTVEGLCVTYMPRPLGTSAAADNLQQRARFFGYKKDYLGLCRVYVQSDVEDAFRDYVEHEEFIRSALSSHRGRPLSEWRRDFILTDLLNPTRPNVVGLDIRRIPVDGWMVPGALHCDLEAVRANRSTFETATAGWKLAHGPVTSASGFPQFVKAGVTSPVPVIESVPLKAVLQDLLLKVEVKDLVDAEEHSAILIALASMLAKDPTLVADVFVMPKTYRSRVAGRGLPESDLRAPINQYFSNTAGPVNDKSHVSPERITLHVRELSVGSAKRDSSRADITEVPWFALHVPKNLRRPLIIEERK
ncbi:Z1 domain-containing protein [Delftia acidovorans]